MRDIKFKIALALIAILSVALFYVLILGPKIQGYIVKNQMEGQLVGQQATITSIMQIVNQQGYIVLSDEQNSIVLARNPQLEAQLQESIKQQAQQ